MLCANPVRESATDAITANTIASQPTFILLPKFILPPKYRKQRRLCTAGITVNRIANQDKRLTSLAKISARQADNYFTKTILLTQPGFRPRQTFVFEYVIGVLARSVENIDSPRQTCQGLISGSNA
jgi:hypothetical protein